jgi:pimeloyl-ACP methyl ester carboxylesterase
MSRRGQQKQRRFKGVMTGGIGLPAVRFPQLLVLAGHLLYRLWGGLAARTLTVDGLKWSYLDGGRGEAVVFVHGFGADKYRFGPVVPSISRSFRVIAPDLPGFGQSSKPTTLSYDIPSQSRRLAAFLDAVGLDRFHLFGLSMGGYLSAFYAAQHPERVLSLALIDAAGVRSPTPSHMLRRYEEDGTVLLLYRNRRQFEELLSSLFYDPPWIPGFIKGYTVRQSLADFDVRRKVLDDLVAGGTDLLDGRLEDIRAETLVMWGADDKIVDPSSVNVFTRGIPKSRAVVFEACGHVPIIEKWRESSRVYREFLAEIALKGRAA